MSAEILHTTPAYADTLSYFNGTEIAADNFLKKYALRDANDKILEPTPDYMHRRIANAIARVESKKFKNPLSAKEVYHLIKDFKYIIPQGSPMYGIDNPQYVTLSNCYVIQPPYDSYGGIHYTDEQITQISKRRGGVGTDISNIRPIGLPTKNSSRRTTGLIPFAERFSRTIREVGQDGRRGALMLTLSVHHPEVEGFASIKLDKQKVTGANLSIKLTNEFLEAVKNDGLYQQRWPVDSDSPEVSNWVRARDVWNHIIKMAWTMAEPGLLFWDRIIKESPADCYSHFGFRTISTNPCSELPLSLLDSCRLLLLNLFSFVRNPFSKDAFFDFRKFYEYAKIAQRLMDDIVDLEIECINRIIGKICSDPEPDYIKQREISIWENVLKACMNGRRTGTGISLLGDTIAAVGLPYASDEGIKLAEQIYSTLKHACYQSSVEMARELGAFPVYDHDLEKDNPFLLRIKEEDIMLYREMCKYGRRNIAILTTAPAGTSTQLAGPRPYFGGSSGIEPAFSIEDYERYKKINANDKHARVDRVDANGDSWTKFTVRHPKLQMWMDVTGKSDPKESPYYGSCANDINWKRRVELQGRVQKHIDHSISSTINLPAYATEEQVGKIYLAAWEHNCKGITVYRDGCRDGVLLNKKETCPNCSGDKLKHEEGCVSCMDCGWGRCSI
jgi:ribonucleoside-diphosphate reductase alpha chain